MLWYRLSLLGQIFMGKKKEADDDFYACRGVTNLGCWLNNRQWHLFLSHEKLFVGFKSYMGAAHSY